MKIIKHILLFSFLSWLGGCVETRPEPAPEPTPLPAAEEQASLPEIEEKADIPAQIGMVTGSATGTYIKIGQDIAKIADKANIKIIVKESEGSLDNIRRINSNENAALGIVQSDVLGYLGRHQNAALRRFVAPLRVVFPLYHEEVHLFAQKNIASVADLEGKRVITGSDGSGNFLTAQNILGIMNVTPEETLNLAPEPAMMAVLRGEADAMFYVSGKPVDLFTRLNNLKSEQQLAPLLENVHFVPLTEAKILAEYTKSTLTARDYPWLKNTVPTVAVRALLVSFSFAGGKTPYQQARCAQLGQLGQLVRDNLDTLKRVGHPKWRQVNLGAKTGRWKRDECVLGGQDK
jgi:TRAP transporter TAXI family solute receptor